MTGSGDRTPNPRMSDAVIRRTFLVGCGSLLAAIGGFVAGTFRFLIPNVLYEPSRRFDIGSPDQFPQDSVTFLPDRRLFVVNEGGFISQCRARRLGAFQRCFCPGCSAFAGGLSAGGKFLKGGEAQMSGRLTF